eukprot:1194149-Rhodomonas_salina.1
MSVLWHRTLRQYRGTTALGSWAPGTSAPNSLAEDPMSVLSSKLRTARCLVRLVLGPLRQ